MNDRITMSDVAKRAGVHVTTVSLALRNHPSLPLSTRQRLQSLAKQMGYRSDPAMRALIAYRQQTRPHKDVSPLAYVTHWNTRWGWKRTRAHARFFAGALAKAGQLGYKLEHFWLGEPGLTPQRLSDIFFARGIRGLIIASHTPRNDAPLQFDWAKFSGVKIDFCPTEPQLHNVTNDQRAIIQLAMQRAIAAGYRRIGFVMPWWWDRFMNFAWSAGFLAMQQMLKKEERIPILVFSGPAQFESPQTGRNDGLVPRGAFEEWFRRHRPEVLISKEQFVQGRLAEMGLAVPGDVGYVEIYLDPDGRTAGVHHNCHRVGEVAVEILAGQLLQYTYGIPEFPTTTLVEGTWVDGTSLPPRIPPARQADRHASIPARLT